MPLPWGRDEDSPGVDEGEEHDRRFASGETVRCSWLHVEQEPGPASSCSPSAVNSSRPLMTCTMAARDA
jgi:hypothetical protein